MRDLVDSHREKISAAAAARDAAIIAATAIFQEAVAAYRDATQRAADEYSAAVTASEAALDVLMERRTADFFGETPLSEPVIRFTAPGLPHTEAAPGGFVEHVGGGVVNGGAMGMEGGQ